MQKTILKSNQSPTLKIALVLIAALSFFALVLQTWVMLRLPLWSDELDHISTALLPWRGDGNAGQRSFWWLLGQFNANPPGDNLIVRALYRSGLLSWMQELSPELFWRFYYLFLYFATPLIAFCGAYKFTRSAFLAFFAYVFMLASPGLFLYASEARFYTSLVFYMTASTWLFLLAIDTEEKKYFFALCFVAALGVVTHLMLASIGYLALAYAFFRIYTLVRNAKPTTKNLSAKTIGECATLLLAGFLPFTIYKVALKHWVYISRPFDDASPIKAMLALNLEKSILTPVSASFGSQTWMTALLSITLIALIALAAKAVAKKDRRSFFSSTFFLAMLIGTPLALYLSAAMRHYDMHQRHFLYAVPLFAAAIVYLARTIQSKIKWSAPALAQVAIMLTFTCSTASFLNSSAAKMRDSSQAKSTYPLTKWREFYRRLPGKHQLVVVGSAPDNVDAHSDAGTFHAGHMAFYTMEFNPLFYGKRGTYAANWKNDASLASKIESNPEHYDYLILDGRRTGAKNLQKLPWSKLDSSKCFDYENAGNGGSDLSFCRL